MKMKKQFRFEKARRITEKEVAAFKKAIEEKTGTKRPDRSKPAKKQSEK